MTSININAYQAVVFDLDGVITFTDQAHFEAWQWLAESLHILIDESLKDEVRGISRMASLEKLLAKSPIPLSFSDAEKTALANKKNEYYKQLIKGFSPDNLVPQAHELLAFLKAQNLKIGLASASRNAPFLLETMGISAFFDCVIDPNMVENPKPAPDIFAMACQQLGVLPEYTIGVEDAPAGIDSIHAAGLFSVGVGEADLLKHANLQFNTLSDFFTWCQTILTP